MTPEQRAAYEHDAERLRHRADDRTDGTRRMSRFARWRLATPLILLSLLGLGAIVTGGWLFWSVQSTAERALTAFLAIMMAINVATAVSIGTDRRLDDVPWLRIGTVVLFFVLSCGVAVVRRNL